MVTRPRLNRGWTTPSACRGRCSFRFVRARTAL